MPLCCLLFLCLVAAATQAAPDIAQLRVSALAGDPWAQLNLGAAYDHGLGGVQADPQQAVRWYRAAAQQGLDKAQFNLAHCLATGHGVPQDYVEARTWMRQAASQGMAEAQFLLGVMLLEGLGGGVDIQRGRDWMRRAAAAGNPDAADYLQANRSP